MEIAGVVVAIFALVVAIWGALSSQRSAKAAERATRIAEVSTEAQVNLWEIEKQRRGEETEPQINLRITRGAADVIDGIRYKNGTFNLSFGLLHIVNTGNVDYGQVTLTLIDPRKTRFVRGGDLAKRSDVWDIRSVAWDLGPLAHGKEKTVRLCWYRDIAPKEGIFRIQAKWGDEIGNCTKIASVPHVVGETTW